MVKQKVRKQFYVIAYDIGNNKRRTKLVQLLENYGLRVNYSVFECMLTTKQLHLLQDEVNKLIHPQKDNVLFYRLCLKCFSKKQVFPPKKEIDNGLVRYV